MSERQSQQQQLHHQLIKITQAWALHRPIHAEQTAQLRAQVLLLNHRQRTYAARPHDGMIVLSQLVEWKNG